MNWKPIESARTDRVIWAFNGEQARMRWLGFDDGDGMWIWDDETLSEIDPCPEQPTHYMPLPEPPSAASPALLAALSADDGAINPLAHEQSR